MNKKRFREYTPDQVLLLPPSLRDWLPPEHLVYFISDAVEKMDLSSIYGAYEEVRGQPPYAPRMVVKVWLYAYSQGVRSSRRVEKRLYEDIAFRIVAGNQQPDHWTLNDFRRRHHEALGDLFRQTVQMAKACGLVKMGHVAVDGTKVKANASLHSAMSYGRMEEEEKRLRAEIEQYFRECDEIDAEEDRLYGDRRGDELPDHLATREKRLQAIEEAMKALEEEARQKAEEQAKRKREPEGAGEGRRGRRQGRPPRSESSHEEGKPAPKAQRNFTDPESRVMKDSSKAFVQAYNAQVAVDASSQVIVAADLTNMAADGPHLEALIEQTLVNTGAVPREVSADAGYWSEGNLEKLGEKGIEVFMPPEKVKHSQWRALQSPRGRKPKGLTLKDLMRRKLRTKRGRARYKLRMMTAEPVIGQIKEGRGLRQFLLRGVQKVRSLWQLDCAVHNLVKMFRANVTVSPVVAG